ncbi:MAG: hypothetical protein ACOCV1_06335 [Bacillota bacterium]
MDKVLLEVNKRKLLNAWKENGHFKDLFNIYLDSPEEVLGDIVINDKFTLDFKDIWVNIGQVSLDCFTKESQQLLRENEELLDYLNVEDVLLTDHKDKIFTSRGEKTIVVSVQL